MPRKNILLAMYDIKPPEKTADLALSENAPAPVKPAKVEKTLQDLAEKIERSSKTREKPDKEYVVVEPKELPQNLPTAEVRDVMRANRARLKASLSLAKYEDKEKILREFEQALTDPADVLAELAGAGIRLHELPYKPESRLKLQYKRYRNAEQAETVLVAPEPDERINEFWVRPPEPVLTSHHTSSVEHTPFEIVSPASREIEIWLENIKNNRSSLAVPSTAKKPDRLSVSRPAYRTGRPKSFDKLRALPKWSSWFRFNRRPMMWLLALLLGGSLVFSLAKDSSTGIKNNVLQNGNNAVANLEGAKHSLDGYNFAQAADGFALAYDDFNKASGKLNQLGASFLNVFGSLPGLGKIKAANNLIEAGQAISKAGENLSLAFATLYGTNLFSFIDSPEVGGSSLSKLLGEFKDVLVFADKNIKTADKLLADIDSSVIPEDKRELFEGFKERVPEFQKYIGDAINYSDFLHGFIGASGKKTYLVLLQNNNELRATGGFPGNYALLTFENGNFKKVFVDDIYRLDAGLKENFIPPRPMQHITPNWGLRDANWFADFPASARKIQDFYKLDTGGQTVDGVLTITPEIIARILKIIGPIKLPNYSITLDSENLLDKIQEEVEYLADRSAPKQILKDLQPIFFERLSSQNKENWLEIFKTLLDATREKHILAYFNDSKLQDTAIRNGFGGEVKQTMDDYLQVVFTNIKGSKTDFVTDNFMSLKVAPADAGLEHELTISRVHNGGGSKYGFYNRDNSAYIKVFVPKGAALASIEGHSIPDFRPLIPHEDYNFKKDPDLAALERGTSRPYAGVDVWQESSKTVFGFWMITRPQNKKTVTLKYSLPAGEAGLPAGEAGLRAADDSYSLYWQKQSGTSSDKANFSFKLPEGKKLISQSPGLQNMWDTVVLDSDLLIDRKIEIKFR